MRRRQSAGTGAVGGVAPVKAGNSHGVLLVASKTWTWQSGATTDSRQSPSGALLSFSCDPRTGLIEEVLDAVPVASPSYIAYSSELSFAYASSDYSTGPANANGDTPRGHVNAIRIDRSSGRLEFMGRQPAAGQVPCHLAVHQAGQHVVCAHYDNGALSVYPIREDGALREVSDVARRRGAGSRHDRQAGPHPHMVYPVSGSEWMLVPDLGTDEIAAYRLGVCEGRLAPREGESARVRPGLGPRHLAVQAGTLIYVANELSPIVSVLRFEGTTGELVPAGEFPAATAMAGGADALSGLALSANGRALFVAVRGRDTISVFDVDGPRPVLLEEVECGGEPRDLAVVGNFVYSANQMSDSVSTFSWDPVSGLLGRYVQLIELPAPSCVVDLGPRAWSRRTAHHAQVAGLESRWVPNVGNGGSGGMTR